MPSPKRTKEKNISNNKIEIYNKFIDKCEDAIKIYFAITKDNTVTTFLTELKHIKVNITGDDLIQLGMKPSKEFSVILNQLLEKKLLGENLSKQEELEFAKTFLK